MKIADVRTMVLGTDWRDITFVVVETDEGIDGVGETRMVNNTRALLGYLSEAVPNHVIGLDPFQVELLVQRIWRDNYSRAGDVAMAAAATIEMACWDIIGKTVGLPVYRLLGGEVRSRVKAYANGWYRVPRTPDEFHRAAHYVVERGYEALKLDPFGPGRYELEHGEFIQAISLVEAVRDAVGEEVDIFVEMHGRFTPAQAIAICRELEPFHPGWVEEPVPPENLRALKRVADRVDIPIATGERIHTRHDFRELFELQAAAVIQPDLTMCGGILETKKIAAWADSYYMLMAPHNVGGPVSTAAALHLAVVTPNFKILEYFNDFCDPYVKDAVSGNPQVVDGHFSLPVGAGLGLALDKEFIASHPPRSPNFNLFKDNWQLRNSKS
jgi:galactonate dehydratase